MRYPFNRESLDKVSNSSIAIDASLRNLVCEFLLRIKSNKIDIDQSYVEIKEQEKPYVEIKIFSKQGLVAPIEIYMFESEIEVSIGKVLAIESFIMKTQKDKVDLQKTLTKWLAHKVKEILFFKGSNLSKSVYRYFDGQRFRSLYFEIDFVNMFWMGRREEKIYEPWID